VKKSLILTALIILFAGSVAWGQATPPDAPASRDDILKLFDVMQIRQQMRSVMDEMLKQQKDLAHEMIRKRYPQTSAAKIAEFDRVMEESMREFPVDALLDDMIPVYIKHLTKADADAMSSFYSSPTGKKLLREMPAMTTEAMQVAYGRMEQQRDTLQKRLEDMEKQNHPAPKPAPQSQPPNKPPGQ